MYILTPAGPATFFLHLRVRGKKGVVCGGRYMGLKRTFVEKNNILQDDAIIVLNKETDQDGVCVCVVVCGVSGVSLG